MFLKLNYRCMLHELFGAVNFSSAKREYARRIQLNVIENPN